MTLKEANPGMKLQVLSIGDSPLKQRLMSMGLIPGTEIKVLRSAPFGDPIAIGLRAYNLAMRRDDAALIEVKQVG